MTLSPQKKTGSAPDKKKKGNAKARRSSQMGLSPSKPKQKQTGKPMQPSRVESAREAPKWLEADAHGDVFALTAFPVGTHVDDGSALDTRYVRDERNDRNSQLDPIGILTSVRDGSANEKPRVEYTYTWPEPTTGPLVALAGIWHCTQFTATVDYRDEKARNRVSTVVTHSSSKRRAFRLTHALELGGEISWSKLKDRIKEALDWNVGADGYKKGKSVWEKWLATLPKEQRGLFKTADDTVNVIVKYIRGYVDLGPVQKAAEALARRNKSAPPAKEKRKEAGAILEWPTADEVPSMGKIAAHAWRDARGNGNIFVLDTYWRTNARARAARDLEPIGQLTNVAEATGYGMYTYTWPAPGPGDLEPLSEIWGCTEYTLRGVGYYLLQEARESEGKPLESLDGGGRVVGRGIAVSVTDAIETYHPADMNWASLETRIRVALNSAKGGRTVWEQWRSDLAAEHQALFKTLERTIRVIVTYIKSLVRTELLVSGAAQK